MPAAFRIVRCPVTAISLTTANPALSENRPISERASDDGPFRVDGTKLASIAPQTTISISQLRCGSCSDAPSSVRTTQRRPLEINSQTAPVQPREGTNKIPASFSLYSQPKGSLVGCITRSSSNGRLAALARNEGWFGFTAYFGG